MDRLDFVKHKKDVAGKGAIGLVLRLWEIGIARLGKPDMAIT